jgi:hypothetical protein
MNDRELSHYAFQLIKAARNSDKLGMARLLAETRYAHREIIGRLLLIVSELLDQMPGADPFIDDMLEKTSEPERIGTIPDPHLFSCPQCGVTGTVEQLDVNTAAVILEHDPSCTFGHHIGQDHPTDPHANSRKPKMKEGQKCKNDRSTR